MQLITLWLRETVRVIKTVRIRSYHQDASLHPTNDKKRVVVVGSGAIGLSYGARLLEAELTRSDLCVEFIARRDYSFLREYGFTMRSPDGNVTFPPNAQFKAKIHNNASSIVLPDRGIDWIICCVKSYAFKDMELKQTLEALVGPTTRILLLMNGLQCEREMCHWFGANRVSVGMAFTCVNRADPATVTEGTCHPSSFVLVNHIAYSGLHIGHSLNDEHEVIQACDLWKGTKIEKHITMTQSLRHAQWNKLAWNIPFNGLTIALGGVTTEIIAKDLDLRQLADRVMMDTIDLANTDLTHHHRQQQQQQQQTNDPSRRLPVLKLLDPETVRATCWNLTDHMGAYRTSTVLDLAAGKTLETEYIFDEPYQRAQELSSIQHNTSTATSTPTRGSESSCWPHLMNTIALVRGVARIAEMKRKQGIRWTPTYLPDVIKSPKTSNS